MSFKESEFWIWWKEYGKHFEALSVIILLIFTIYHYYDNTTTLKEVQISCPCAFKYCVDTLEDALPSNKLKNLDINFSRGEDDKLDK